MIAQLSDLSHAAEPTAFHNLLRALDNRGRLLRVYTQNIDAIEQKSGLTFGVPDFDFKRSKSKLKGKARIADMGSMIPDVIQPTIQLTPNRLPSPPVDTPRCIPLHGTLQSMHCQSCNHAFPLSMYLPSLASGHPPPCPECTNLELARKLIGKRPRGIGRLRPSVVLYNEEHKDGEGVGEVVQRDLMGSKGRSGADLLLVVGTSLKVPGTKRMVREFSKAVKARCVPNKMETGSTYALRSSTSGGLATPAASPRRTLAADEDTQLPKAIYLNLDFPVPTREWEGVFDVWIQGDAQLFAETLQGEIDKEARTKEMASERKRRKDEEAAVASAQDELPDLARARERKAAVDLERRRNGKMISKRKLGHESKLHHNQSHSQPSSKKRKLVAGLLTPPHTPPRSKRTSRERSQTREGSLKSPIVAKLTIRLPPPNSQSTDDDAELGEPPPHGRQGRIPSVSGPSRRFYSSSTPSPAYEACTKAGEGSKQSRKTRQRSHFSGPHTCLGPLRTCHQESWMCSSAQCRDGLQDGELNVGPSVPHSSPALMDITVG